VRAGVLRLLSLLPDVTITHGTADGQPALTLTAGAAEFTDPRMAALQKQGILKEGPKGTLPATARPRATRPARSSPPGPALR
jgi:hypothetical protein